MGSGCCIWRGWRQVVKTAERLGGCQRPVGYSSRTPQGSALVEQSCDACCCYNPYRARVRNFYDPEPHLPHLYPCPLRPPSHPSSLRLSAAAALLCHPGLWHSARDVADAATAAGGGGVGFPATFPERPLLSFAKQAILDGVLLSLAATAGGGGGDGDVAFAGKPPVAMCLLPVLAATLMSRSLPCTSYGCKPPDIQLPEGPLWDQVCVCVCV